MTGKRDPFAEVSRAIAQGGRPEDEAGTEAQRPPADRGVVGEWVSPVPEAAPSLPPSHRAHGKPSVGWRYHDGDGRLIQWVCRFDKSDGGKEVLPLTLWREGVRMAWRWKAAPVPRPLYGLDRLAAQSAATVLIVEGEKAADAAARLFPDFAAITWSGGSKAAGKADWSPLAGRRVVILPDADLPGWDAAAKVERLVLGVGAQAVAIVTLPADLPEGWDIADDFPPSFDLLALQMRLADALSITGKGAVKLPWGYRLDAEGLFFHEAGKEDSAGRDVRLSDRFEVLGEARESGGGGWAVVIRFQDRDGRSKTEIVRRADLAGQAGEVRARLAGEGLFIDPRRGRADRFAHFLAEVAHTCRITLAERTGWVDASRFALPAGAIGGPEAEPVLFTGTAAALHYGAKGSLDTWKAEIASRANGNRLLAFVLSLAFVGPVMDWLGLDGGGFHVRGSSSCGKTTLAVAAGTVWGGGGPLGFASSWRATTNALEGVAYGHSETLLILDELALIEPGEAGAVAYVLTSGQGKARSKQDGSLRRRAEWRVALLSTGEIGLADHMRSDRRGGRTMAGQELRLIDLAADMGLGMGVFEDLQGFDRAALLADAIKRGCSGQYGHAGPAFVRGLLADRDRWATEVRRQAAAFEARAKRDGDSGQIHRAARRFGAVAAAGEVATMLGVLPWPEGTAHKAALACFERWASGFGRQGLREVRQIITTVRNAIQQNLSRFGKVTEAGMDGEAHASARAGEARSLSTLGYVHEVNFQTVYLFHEAGWAEILKGYDLKEAARSLIEAGHMWPGEGGRLKRRQRVGEQNQRFYTVTAKILEYDEDE